MKHAALSSRHTQLPNLVVYLGFKISHLSLWHISVMLPCIAACCFNPSIILASTCSLWGDTGSSLISICMIFAGSDRVIAWIPDHLNSACINHLKSELSDWISFKSADGQFTWKLDTNISTFLVTVYINNLKSSSSFTKSLQFKY